jgi:16S rRNA (uracil1498-N3)-methyltransferase
VNRFFVSPGVTAPDRFLLPRELEHQVRRVLRLGDGDRIVLLPGDGSEAICRLEGSDCVVEERSTAAGEPRHRLTICQALLKGDGLEQVIQHATEVGVARIRLVLTERCVARQLSPHRLERLRTIAREAAEQSERGVVPAIDAPEPLRAVLDAGSVMLLERHAGARLGEIPVSESVIIGPEGGFAPGEVVAAQAAGVVPAGLGPRILRSETVAPVVAALILSRTGDFA